MRVSLVSAIAVVCLSACTSTESLFQGPEQVQTEDSLFFRSDASQRYILTAERTDLTGARTMRITCVEPSPDVAVATSNLLAASLSAQGGANVAPQRGPEASPSEFEGSIGTGFSSGATQSVAELGRRLATVQLLRDSLYRACEAYANGAINEASYAMILSRYDDIAVTLMMAEMMGGVTDQRVAISAAAGAPSISTTADADGDAGAAGSTSASGEVSSGSSASISQASGSPSIGTGDSFLRLQENFLSDNGSIISSLTMACTSILSRPRTEQNAGLYDRCAQFADYLVEAAPTLLNRD